MKDLRNSATEAYKNAYQNGDIDGCVTALALLAVYYNKKYKNELHTEGGFKKWLFMTNCIKSPLSFRYDDSDYRKTIKSFYKLKRLLEFLNEGNAEDTCLFKTNIKMDQRILDECTDILVYTRYLFTMAKNNMNRIEESPIMKMPLTELLIMIMLFRQDQNRLLREKVHTLFDDGFVTGIETVVSNQPVNYYDGFTSSIADSYEADLESTDELVRYLYYRTRDSFPEKCDIDSVNFDQVCPYANSDFEKLKFISLQSHMLNLVEMGFRYGFLKYGYVFEDGSSKGYMLFIDSEPRYKAHILGVFRRQVEIRMAAELDIPNQTRSEKAVDKIDILAMSLIRQQKDGYKIYDLSIFHPDKECFSAAESVMSVHLNLIKQYTKDVFLDCEAKGIKICDLITTFIYLGTLSEVLQTAAEKSIDKDDPATLSKQLAIVDIAYFELELSRLYNFTPDNAQKLICQFTFSEENNRREDIFSNPLLKISKRQVLFCPSLLEQLNMDRKIERILIDTKTAAHAGKQFEKEFIRALQAGYVLSSSDKIRKKIKGFSVNTNKVEYSAFDGENIEFDIIISFKNYLVLVELKSMLASYDLDDLESRRKHISDAKKQLLRRRESVQYDWDKIREIVSIDLPEKPYDYNHIIMVACSDSYDYTPLFEDGVYISDRSSFLKFFTSPYVEAGCIDANGISIKKHTLIWKHKNPTINEFKSYLKSPITIKLTENVMSKEYIPVPIMDENDIPLVFEEFKIKEDPIRKAFGLT